MAVSPHLLSNTSRVLLGAALCAAVLFGGSWRATFYAISGGIAIAAFGLIVLVSAERSRALRVPWLAVVLFALSSFTALQAVDVGDLLAVLSPQANELWSALDHPARSITYERAATWREASKYTLYGLVVITAHELVRRRSMRLVLVGIPVAVCLSVAVALLHHAFGLESLFGVIPRRSAEGIGLTTLPNTNHASGLANLGAFVALGLGLIWQGVRTRAAMFVISGGLALVSLLQGSLGGLIGLLAGLALFVASSWRSGSARPSWEVLPAFVLPTVGGLVAFNRVAGELSIDASSPRIAAKLEGLVSAWPMILDHWAFGVGRGAFVSAFTRYRASSVQLTYAFPESIPVQLTSEWGLAVGGAALLGLVATIVVRVVRVGNPLARATLAGVFALVAHNFVDFSLEVPGVALPVAVALGATTPSLRRDSRMRLKGSGRLMLAAGAVAAWLLCVAAMLGAGDLDRDLGQLQSLVRAARRGHALDLSRAKAIGARHPASAAVQMQVAYVLTYAPEPDRAAGLQAINDALLLAPKDAQAALLAGRILAGAGFRRQGLEESRRAWQLTGGAPSTIRAAAGLARNPQAFLHAVPRRDGALDLVDEVALARAIRTLRTAHPDWMPTLVAALPPVEQIPVEALGEVARAAIVAGEPSLAEAVVRAQLAHDPNDPTVLATQAHLAARAARWDEAWASLSGMPKPTQAEPTNLRLRFRVALAREDWPEAEATVRWMARVLPMTRDREARLARLKARIELARGRPDRAARAFDQAVLWRPSDLGLRLARARALLDLGRIADATSDLRFILRRDPGHAAAKALLEQHDGSENRPPGNVPSPSGGSD